VTREQERGLVLLIAVGLLVGGAVLLWPRPQRATGEWGRPIAVEGVRVMVPTFVEAKKIDINVASAVELTQLPGIGPVLAERIIAYRQVHGSFATLDALTAVKGVGPSIVERLRGLALAGGD